MIALRLPWRRRRPSTAEATLDATQIGWLGAAILAAQLPQAPHLPIWVALLGFALVGLRLWLAVRDRRRPGSAAARIPSWALVLFAVAIAALVRASYGYLLGRDPSVAFLFVLVGIKFLEARAARDGTLLVCLAAFLAITPFLFGQSPLAAVAMLPAIVALAWFATLVALADGLNRVGFVKWFADSIASHMAGFAPFTVMVALVLVFFVTHYLFASITAHVTALLPVMLAVGSTIPGMDMPQFALLLCLTLGIMGVLTPYATGPSPVYYGSGYLPAKDYWKLGAVFGFIFIALFLVVTLPWMAIVGGR